MRIDSEKKAQASVEYLILFAIITAVIAPITYLLYSSLQTTDLEVSSEVIKNLGLKMISKAEEIYYLPPPAKISYSEEIPVALKSVQNISEEAGNIISFVLEEDVEIPLITKVPVKINETNITEGTKTIVILTNTSDEGFIVDIDIR